MNYEESIRHVIDAVSNAYGDAFFDRMTQSLAQAVNADFCFIGRVNEAHSHCQTISTFAHGQHVDNFSYALLHTPCAEVTTDGVDVYPFAVADTFYQDLMLKDMDVEAYIGASLKNSDDEVLGLVVALFHEKIDDPEPIHTLYKLFAGRIAAEIDSHEKSLALKAANDQLEEKVVQRTEELEEAMHHLIDQEKFASLGILVSGIAHEINTPLGISITSESIIEDILLKIEKEMASKQLTQSGLRQHLDDLKKTSSLIQRNLRRAADLINNFKQVAANKSNFDKVDFNLKKSVADVIETLHSVLKHFKFRIELDIAEDLYLHSQVGDFQQIVSNFIMNAAQHAFTEEEEGLLLIKASMNKNKLYLKVKDNGKGIDDAHLKKIFTPFYTSRRGAGASGLGLSIIYNNVKQNLKGDIKVQSKLGEGTEFNIRIPLSLLSTQQIKR